MWKVEKKDRRCLVLSRVVVHELRGQGVEQTIRGMLKMLQMMAGTWWREKARGSEPSAEVINGWQIFNSWNFQVI